MIKQKALPKGLYFCYNRKLKVDKEQAEGHVAVKYGSFPVSKYVT
jgi:hypothetical protein